MKYAKQELLSPLLLAWGAAWWALSLMVAVLRWAPEVSFAPLMLCLTAATVGLWGFIALRLRWPGLATLCLTLMPACGLLLLCSLLLNPHPFANWGWLGWAAVLLVHGLSLRLLANLAPERTLGQAHVLGCWLVISVLALELSYAMSLAQPPFEYSAWSWLGWALIPSLYLVAMTSPRNWPWPIAAYPKQYRVLAAAPVALLMLAWFWLANMFSDGAANPLPYVPLINPLELSLLFALMGVFVWVRKMLPQLGVAEVQAQRGALVIAGSSLFALVTLMVLRSAHHWDGIAWNTHNLLESMRVQAGLSIVWTLMALTLMIGGHMRARREVWITGAVLIGVVVAKLFFVELSNRGGIARIVSFIGVGVLLLVVGYFAPLPPKRPAKDKDNSHNREPDTP